MSEETWKPMWLAPTNGDCILVITRDFETVLSLRKGELESPREGNETAWFYLDWRDWFAIDLPSDEFVGWMKHPAGPWDLWMDGKDAKDWKRKHGYLIEDKGEEES